MTPEELPDYVESLRSLQEKYKDRISLKIGLECEYFPDYLHWLKEVIREFKLITSSSETITSIQTRSFLISVEIPKR